MKSRKKLWAACLLGTAFCLMAAPQVEAGQNSESSTIVRTDPAQVAKLREIRQEKAESQRRQTRQAASSEQRKIRDVFQKRKDDPRGNKKIQYITRWETEAADSGGTLLLSDSPEYVSSDGILYEDKVDGSARVFYYHLNDTKQPKKIAVVLTCEDDDFTKVHVRRGGMNGGSDNYFAVGKAVQAEYFENSLRETLYFMKGSTQLLQPRMSEVVLQPGEIVCGMYDFDTTHPIKVSVLMYPTDADPCSFVKTAKILPKSESRLRGTFQGMNRTISGKSTYDPAANEAVYVCLADGDLDPFKVGVDATDGSVVVNYGNYGVLYRVKLKAKNTMPTRYMLMPLGGTYAGVMTASQGSFGKKEMLMIPLGKTFFGENGIYGVEVITPDTDLADLGVYDGSKEVIFEFSPPGASNLPVNLVMMPSK